MRGNSLDAQGIIVELVWRLVAASSPRPKERRFPLGDSTGQPGPDGVLDTDFPFPPFVSEGRSFWEIGTGLNAGAKATADYNDLVAATPEAVRLESEFVFVSPLSGRRGWPHTWKEDAQADWQQKHRTRNEWRAVRVIDGTKLIDWLHQFPSVELWLARKMRLQIQQIETPEWHWSVLRTIGDPPPLIPDVFLTNREAAYAKLKAVFSGSVVRLKLDTHFPDQVVDFVCAYVAAMDEEARIDAVGRCLVISGTDAWNAICAQRERHILVADPDLDLSGPGGAKLLEKARRAGHAVIFGAMPGGIPDPNSEPIPSPKNHQVKESLEKAGYSDERARIVAQKSGGNLSVLLRCLQNLSQIPGWAERTAAADLVIAELLGAWNDKSEADRTVAESLSGKGYGEWIEIMRDVTLRPGTPLTQRDGSWKFITRYEGWYDLGPRLSDNQLDRLRETAVAVLRERDPGFGLSSEERYTAGIQGKVLRHSHRLRNGLAETLALLGSHPKALTGSSFGKPEATAVLAVREVFAAADWRLWASLNDVLPLLAEAAPHEFLNAVEAALTSYPCPLDQVFTQEGSGIMGANYMTGLLWALETLAWDAAHLTRAVVNLGELAARDPGGQWANRPAASLTTILLPWLPQTCASVAQRKAAVESLLAELPDVAWKLLLSLLPRSHQISTGSRKPAWRETIPDDWSKSVTRREYMEQVAAYAELAVDAAKSDPLKLTDLIKSTEDLPPPAGEHLLEQLGSDAVISMPETDRLPVWTALVELVARHRKFADASWGMKPDQVVQIASLAERLAPTAPLVRHQRLFSERDADLFEEKGNWQEQHNELEKRRQRAVEEIASTGGVHAVLEFAKAVQSPWRVGGAAGLVAGSDTDRAILPELLDTDQESLAQFAAGFVRGRFGGPGWAWVDQTDTSQWLPTQIGQLLAYLPFTSDTWERSARLLGQDESPYWTRTSANPYDADKDLEVAVDQLIRYGRPHAAIRCLGRLRDDARPFDGVRAVRALLAAVSSSEGAQATDAYEIAEIIKALQDDTSTNSDDLFKLEWAYLPLLDRHLGALPKLLERRLADDPKFFCEVIRLVFRSKKEERPTEAPSEQAKNIAGNAYRLLHQWQTPPGLGKDGIYDGDALGPWLEAVVKECTETGHLEVAMTMVGHAMIHTPSDPTGLWIHCAAAAALNAKDAADLRDGFRTELFNSRGVHGFSAGQEERKLATKYRTQADAVGTAGFHRLATTLRELATSYEQDADRESSRDLFDE